MVPYRRSPRDSDNCPGCAQPSRTRSVPVILSRVVSPALAALPKPLRLLGFAVTRAESKVLEPLFPEMVSVSLFGNYGRGHQNGVDARDLSQFPDASFTAHFSILLFDYFEEMEKGLAEAWRVLQDGGLLLTMIGTYRLTDDAAPPRQVGTFETDPARYHYIPAGQSLGDVHVGKDWFASAMARAGFAARIVTVRDVARRERLVWFIGVKTTGRAGQILPPLALRARMTPTLPQRARAGGARMIAVLRARASMAGQRLASTPMQAKSYAIPLAPGDPAKMIEITLSLPRMPEAYARDAGFAEHAYDRLARRSTQTVVCTGNNGRLIVSDDLGTSWRPVTSGIKPDDNLLRCFTTSTGRHIVQTRGWDNPGDDGLAGRLAELVLFDKNWTCIGRTRAGVSHWHGTASIDEAGGVILFAEYPNNALGYSLKSESERAKMTRPSCVWRSRDDGSTWEKLLEIDSSIIRHFHTCRADPHRKGVWWLSSGDRAAECYVWRSDDDGDTWLDVTNPEPGVPLHRHFRPYARAIHRHTDLWIGPDEMIWGTDDHQGSPQSAGQESLLSERVGSRIYRVAKSGPQLAFTEAGFAGQPVRSIIDAGPGLVFLTEAKQPMLTLRPEVHFMFKGTGTRPRKILDIDNFSGKPTGFSYSLASRAALDGVFFCYRHVADGFSGRPCILRWDIKIKG